MANKFEADAFVFKPYFPGIPWPEWDQPRDLEIEIVPTFPGIPVPLFDQLKVAGIEDARELDQMEEIATMADFGMFG